MRHLALQESKKLVNTQVEKHMKVCYLLHSIHTLCVFKVKSLDPGIPRNFQEACPGFECAEVSDRECNALLERETSLRKK